MISPARDAYGREREAQGQAPKSIDSFESRAELDAALVTDRWYIGCTMLALTLAWVSNALCRWPVSGVAGMIEAAAFAGLAGQQIEGRLGPRRSAILYGAWAALACAGAPNLPWDAVWLAAAPAVVVTLLATRQPMVFALVLPAGLPWVQTPTSPWEVRLAQSVLLLIAGIVMTAGWKRPAGVHLKRVWDRAAVASWLVLVLPSMTTAAAWPTLIIAVVGLCVAWRIRNRFRDRPGFLPVVLVWAGLHLLGLRTPSCAMPLHVALILSGFLLLVIAGWRFAAARRRSVAPGRLLNSPMCVVPDLTRSRDYPLEIYVP